MTWPCSPPWTGSLTGRARVGAAIESNNECLPARLNLGLVEAELSWAVPAPNSGEEGGPTGVSAPPEGAPTGVSALREGGPASGREADRSVGPNGPVRVAVLSFLFNWPSTGGGNMHTAGLVDFLGRDGYEVRHFFARYPGWGIGRVKEDGLVASEAIEFAEGEWSVAAIRERFRAAVDSFGPDYVVISDAWNMKPHLAEAMRGYPYYLLLQAQECLCPLNNLRLLGIGPTQVEQCPRNQLATPQVCHQCLAERGHHAGALHQHERALAGVGTEDYDRMLRQSFYEAEAVLVLNPITAALVEPYARRVCIVPWGIDAARFPWAADEIGFQSPRGRQLSAAHRRRCRPFGTRRGGGGVRWGDRIPGVYTALGVCTPSYTISPRWGFGDCGCGRWPWRCRRRRWGGARTKEGRDALHGGGRGRGYQGVSCRARGLWDSSGDSVGL